MSADAAPFRLVSTPPNSFDPRGFRVLAGLLVGAAGAGSAVFAAVGAWPVAGFLGLEAVLAAWLIARHAKRSAAAVEEVTIEGDRLVVRARDARGRFSRTDLDAYWARLERPADGRLLLVSRQRRVEVGRFLSDAERDAFAAALAEALARHRRAV
ncbi:MAG: DUF2244 domain-containing protein [Acetobacteraceae bacterium]|nr:DUF2244 domain-containing protein [Acetobacteraceae bacterium]MDW8397480.1 DUF2244 domain-containing protein [Acetobacteraceae bacterium]